MIYREWDCGCYEKEYESYSVTCSPVEIERCGDDEQHPHGNLITQREVDEIG